MPSIQLKHDTSTNWTTYNPVLLAGEVGIETDTNKMKIGDGTTAYNSLDYFVGDIDLSAYYNKTQTDGLLSEKQDILSPNPPLTITEYTKSNLYGFSYTVDSSGVYGTDGTSGYVVNAVNGYNTVVEPKVNYSYNSGAWNNPSSGYNADSWKSYIDIPYTLGQTVFVPNCRASIFGKFVDGKFIPIIAPCNSGTQNISVYLSDAPYLDSSDGYKLKSTVASVQTSVVKGESPTPATLYGTFNACISQIKDNGTDILFTFRRGNTSSSDLLYSLRITDSSTITRLKEITTIRVCSEMRWSSSDSCNSTHPYPVSNFGLYNIEGDVATLLEDITNITSQPNLFDISGETKQTYLDLHIGSGLTVQNGNLINTNPTAITVDQTYNASSSNPQSGVAIAGAGFLTSIPTASTSTLGGVKVDGTTVTIDSNGVISSSGGGGGTVDQTYDATSTNAQSGTAVAEAVEDKVDNSDLADITELYPTLSGLGMPSATDEDLTFTHGASYIAPADGYFSIQGYRTNGSPVMGFFNVTANIYSMTNCMNTDSSSFIGVVIPAHKGDTVQAYNYNNVTSSLKFVYAIGSESEAS